MLSDVIFFFFDSPIGRKLSKKTMAHSSSHSERSIHEMLKDAPPMNESNSAIQSGIEGRVKHPSSLHIRTNSGMYHKVLL